MNDLEFTRGVNAPVLRQHVGGMADLRQWFIYFLTPDPKNPDKFRKIPCGPNGPSWDSVKEDYQGIRLNQPYNWSSFDQAVAACNALEKNKAPGTFYTLGFCFTQMDPYFFFDMDFATYDEATRAQELVKWSTYFGNCFIETSSSGKGYHIVGRYHGNTPDHINRPKGIPLELYTKDRGMAFGLSWASEGCADQDMTGQLHAVISQIFPPNTNVAANTETLGWRDRPISGWNGYTDDAEMLTKACQMKSIAARFSDDKVTFDDLWNLNRDNLRKAGLIGTDGELDESLIEAKLCYRLAWLTGCDMVRMEKLLYNSRHYRPKWNEMRPFEGQKTTYIRMTIMKECRKVVEPFNKEFHKKDGAAPIPHADLVSSTNQLGAPNIQVDNPNAERNDKWAGQNLPEIPELIAQEVFAMINNAENEQQIVDAVAIYVGSGEATPIMKDQLLAAVQLIMETNFRKVNKTELKTILNHAYLKAVKDNPICQSILTEIKRQWVFNTVRSSYVRAYSDGIVCFDKEDGAFLALGRFIQDCGLPGYLIEQAYPSYSALLHNIIQIPHVVASAYFPTPHNLPPIRLYAGHDRAATLLKINELRNAAGDDREQLDALAYVESFCNRHKEGFVNLYNYQAIPEVIAPSEQWENDFQLWFNRVLVPLCGHRQEVAQVIMWFIAHNVKYPGVKIRWSPLIIGPQRCGKSTICEVIRACVGLANTKKVMPHNLERKFTGFAQGHALVILDELKVSGKQKFDIANMLKPYITDETVDVEKKGENGIDAVNVTNYIATSNYDTAIPQEQGDKRWFAVRVPADTPEGVLTLLGCRTEQEKNDLFNRVYRLFSSSEAAAMFRHRMLSWVPQLPPHMPMPQCASLPFETDEKQHIMRYTGSGFLQSVLKLLEMDVSPFITDQFIVVKALAQAFEVAKVVGGGFASFKENGLAGELAQLGYRLPKRVKVNGKLSGTIYGKSDAAIQACADLLKETDGFVPGLSPSDFSEKL